MNINIIKSPIIVAVTAIIGSTISCASFAQQSNDGKGFALEEIIVTARRVEESLMDTPIAITAISGQMLEDRGAEQISAVANFAPNVNFSFAGTTSGSDSAAVIYIRGVGQNDFTLVTDPGVGLYVDQVYYSRTVGSVLDLFDISRVEVLRGPQGTLFGRNSTGGAISITTADPDEENGGKVKLLVGDDSRVELSASYDAVINDEFALSFSALNRERDGTAQDASGRDLGDDDMVGARIKSVYRPSENFSLKVSADYVSEDEGSAAEVPLIQNADGSVSSATVIDFTPVEESQGLSVNDVEAFGVSAVAEWVLANDMTFTSVTAFRDLDAMFARTPSSGTNFSTVDFYEHSQFSQEFRLSGSTDLVNYVVGAFYLDEDGENVDIVDVGVAPAGFPRFIDAPNVQNSNYAIFAEGTWQLTDRTRLITGARYTDESKEASFRSSTIPGLTRGTSATDPIIEDIGFSNPQSLDFSETTYRLVLQHDFSDSMNGYISHSTGFKSGGFNQRLVGPLTGGAFTEADSFLPETVDSTEIGFKADFDTVRLNVAAFTSDYEDVQISGNPPGEIATETFNGAEASIDGIEVEVTWVPSPSWLIDFSLGILDAEYEQFIGDSNEVSVDDEFIRTPKHSASLGISYSHDLSSGANFKTRIDITDKGETHFEPDNSAGTFEDGYTSVDLNVAYTTPSEDWVFRAGVNNATDEEYLLAADANSGLVYDLGVFARPRNFYISVETNF